MKAYQEAVEFHAEACQQSLWEEHHLTNIRVLSEVAKRGRVSKRQAYGEANRLIVQSGIMRNGDIPHALDMAKPGTATPLARATVERIRDCASVWVDPDLLDLPDGTDFENENPGLPAREHLPFPDGAVMLFGEEVEVRHPIREDETMQMVGAVWFPVQTFDEEGTEVWKATIYSLVRNEHGVLDVDLSSLWSFNIAQTPIERSMLLRSERADNGESESLLITKIMRYLAYGSDEDMDKTSVAVVDASDDKAAKRAAKKREVPTDVNVIYLNSNKRKVLRGADEGRKDGQGRRRHMVRAFWRRQAYGPNHSLRKWVLVKAHERGSGSIDERPKVYRAS